MPAPKPVKLPNQVDFDEAMRRTLQVPPPPSGKKAQKKAKRKK
jgi:hypothetical protein